MFGKTKWILAGVLAITLLTAGFAGSVALAQGPTPTPPKTWLELYQQILAQKLGTTVEKLQQAMTDARKDAATEGVKQGILTQAQADRMLGNTARGTIANAWLDAAAKTLGMTTTDLTTALRGGKTLLDVAREKNVDVANLRTAIADAEKAAIDQAVKDGKLTQEQADKLKANIKPENIDLNRKSLGAQSLRGRLNDAFQNRFGKFGKGNFGMPQFRR
ncbi:MAG: DUF2680 domain-containing protein, partial [Chloroflexota bacterium]